MTSLDILLAAADGSGGGAGTGPGGGSGGGGTGPGGPTHPPKDSRAEQLDDIDATLIGLLAIAYFGPASQGTSESVRQACAAEVLLHRLRATRRAVAELRDAFGIKTPARHPLNGESALNGGPAQTTDAPVGEEPTPGSAVAAVTAARESQRSDTTPEAGASSGRDEEPALRGSRPEGSTPGDRHPRRLPTTTSRAVANGGDEGRAVGADSAATFTLPRPPEFAVGTADYAGRTR